MAEPYANEEYYKVEYEGDPVKTEDFSKFAKRATRIIDILTDYQIPKIGLDKFSDEVQTMIIHACCAQIEYYQVEGLETDVTGNTQTGGNLSIGSFSYSGSSQTTSKQSNRVAPACLTFLESTGLLRKKGVRFSVI